MKVLKSLFTKCLWTILVLVFGWMLGIMSVYGIIDSESFKHVRNKYGFD